MVRTGWGAKKCRAYSFDACVARWGDPDPDRLAMLEPGAQRVNQLSTGAAARLGSSTRRSPQSRPKTAASPVPSIARIRHGSMTDRAGADGFYAGPGHRGRNWRATAGARKRRAGGVAPWAKAHRSQDAYATWRVGVLSRHGSDYRFEPHKRRCPSRPNTHNCALCREHWKRRGSTSGRRQSSGALLTASSCGRALRRGCANRRFERLPIGTRKSLRGVFDGSQMPRHR